MFKTKIKTKKSQKSIESLTTEEVLKELYEIESISYLKPYEFSEEDAVTEEDLILGGILGKYPAQLYGSDVDKIFDIFEEIQCGKDILTHNCGARFINQIVITTDSTVAEFERIIREKLSETRIKKSARLSSFGFLNRSKKEIEEISEAFSFSPELIYFLEYYRGEPFKELIIHINSEKDALKIKELICSQLELSNNKSYGKKISLGVHSTYFIKIERMALDDFNHAVWDFHHPKSAPSLS